MPNDALGRSSVITYNQFPVMVWMWADSQEQVCCLLQKFQREKMFFIQLSDGKNWLNWNEHSFSTLHQFKVFIILFWLDFAITVCHLHEVRFGHNAMKLCTFKVWISIIWTSAVKVTFNIFMGCKLRSDIPQDNFPACSLYRCVILNFDGSNKKRIEIVHTKKRVDMKCLLRVPLWSS